MPIHLRHREVGEDYAGAETRKNAQSIDSVRGRFHFETVLLKQTTNRVSDQHRVVRDQCTSN